MKKAVYLYVLITQFIVTTIALAIGGYFLGNYLQPDTNLGIQLAGAGIAIAFLVNIVFFYIFYRSYNHQVKEDEQKKKAAEEDENLDKKIAELDEKIHEET